MTNFNAYGVGGFVATRRPQPRVGAARFDGSQLAPGGRARLATPTWTRKLPVLTRKKREGTEGGYNQWTRKKKVTGRKVSQSTMDKRLVRANREYKILGFRHVKNFDDNGAKPIHSFTTEAGIYFTPVHAYVLNAAIQDETIRPGRLLAFDEPTKTMRWVTLVGQGPTGLATDEALQLIKQSHPGDQFNRAYHEYTHIKLNLWGAKAKAIRFQIDIIQPLSDEVNPFHWPIGSPMGTAAAQAWEEMIKQYTFNPISKIDHYIKRNFKTVKSMSCIISPTSTTESDADPHVKTIDWFVRFNKLVNFDKVTQNSAGVYTLQNAGDLKSAVQEDARSSHDASELPRDKQCMILLIRASDYSAPQAFTNNIHGSYDIDFRTKFTSLG